MDCLEFRRQCLADPGSADMDYQRHRTGCRACSDYAARMRKFDHQLHEAMSIDPPKNLQSRILLQQSLSTAEKRPVAVYYSMAAAVMMAVLLVLFMPGSEDTDDISKLVFTYLEESPAASTVVSTMDTTTASHLLRPLGMDLEPEFGPIQAARPCVIRGNEAVHMVVEGARGVVDIVFMPSEFIDRKIETVYADRELLIVPCPRGSIAIVGEKGEHLAAIEQNLLGASNWL